YGNNYHIQTGNIGDTSFARNWNTSVAKENGNVYADHDGQLYSNTGNGLEHYNSNTGNWDKTNYQKPASTGANNWDSRASNSWGGFQDRGNSADNWLNSSNEGAQSASSFSSSDRFGGFSGNGWSGGNAFGGGGDGWG